MQRWVSQPFITVCPYQKPVKIREAILLSYVDCHQSIVCIETQPDQICCSAFARHISNNGSQEATRWRKRPRQTRFNTNAAFSQHANPVTWGMWAPRSQWFRMRRRWLLEPPYTYRSHSSEASYHLDSTLSRISTCGTLLWRGREQKEAGEWANGDNHRSKFTPMCSSRINIATLKGTCFRLQLLQRLFFTRIEPRKIREKLLCAWSHEFLHSDCFVWYSDEGWNLPPQKYTKNSKYSNFWFFFADKIFYTISFQFICLLQSLVNDNQIDVHALIIRLTHMKLLANGSFFQRLRTHTHTHIHIRGRDNTRRVLTAPTTPPPCDPEEATPI